MSYPVPDHLYPTHKVNIRLKEYASLPAGNGQRFFELREHIVTRTYGTWLEAHTYRDEILRDIAASRPHTEVLLAEVKCLGDAAPKFTYQL
jgi:hypothetical protein